MKRQPTYLFLLTLLVSASLGWASSFQSTGYARGAAVYLELPVHGYAAGLSRAVTAWRDEGTGAQYNPATIDGADSVILYVSHTGLGDDHTLLGLDATVPIGPYLVVNLSVPKFGITGFDERDEFGTKLGNFGDVEIGPSVSIAGRLQWNIALGARARYLNQRFKGLTTSDGSANGMAFDLGGTWEYGDHLCVGASALNIGSRLFWGTGTTDKILAEGRLGVAGILLDKKLTVEFDAAKKLRQPIDVALGVQYILLDLFYLRGGATTSLDIKDKDYRDPDFSLGAGLRYSYFGFDYGLTMTTDPEVPPRNTFSLVVRFRIKALH